MSRAERRIGRIITAWACGTFAILAVLGATHDYRLAALVALTLWITFRLGDDR
jgi:hypothetical protein